jgi:TolB-like protein/Tfp pilus assembly protein PilF
MLKGYDVPATVYNMVVERDEGVAASETLHRSSNARSMDPRGLWDQIARRRTLFDRRIVMGGLGLLVVLLAWRILSWSGNPSPPDAAVGEGSLRAEVPFERSIAVLPFANIGGSEENEYFSDGMTEEIVANLAKIDDLRVVSRTSVMQYKGTTKLVGEIAEELGVSKILEGSVRRAGDRVRITAQLIDARTDEHLWVESYERQLTDVLKIQTEIALEIASQLEVRLSNEQLARLSARRITNPTAYDFYLRAKEYLQRQRPHDIDAAIALFQEVIDLDSDFAPAHAGLAMAYVARYAVDGDSEKLDQAMRAARRALDLDPTLADGQAALGDAYLYRGQNRLARQAFLGAVELEPNHADAMGGLVATSYVLGRYDEALIWAKRASAIEPTSATYPRQVGFAFTGLGDFEQSDLWLKRALQIEPDNGLAYGGLALNAILRGEPERAKPLLQTMVAVSGDQPRVLAFAAEVHLARRDFGLARSLYERVLESPTAGEMVALADLGFLHLQAGEEKRGRELLDEAGKEARAAMSETGEDWMPAFTLARIHSVLGQREDAYRYLESAIEEGWHGYYDYGKDPLLDPLRSEARFEDLMQAVKDDLERMREAVTAQT